ncbi:unnamed protein product [Closterium sp. NIES-65]|nr:unnamed protein product [Closterium sp. NIES-65]
MLSYRVSQNASPPVESLPFLHLCLLLPSRPLSPVLPWQFGSSTASPPLSADPPTPWASMVAPLPMMAADALALVAVALAEASPVGVLGRQVPALLLAVSALAGLESSSPPSHERRGQSRRSRNPIYRSPPGRAPAYLRPRQQQAFRRTQRQPSRPPRSGLRSVPPLQQTSPLPTQQLPQVPVTRTAPPLPSVPERQPASGSPPAEVLLGGWKKVRLSCRQRQQQSRHQTLAPPQSPPPPRQQPCQSPPAAPPRAQPPPELVTTSPASAASAANSPGAAIPSRLVGSSCSCSCSCDASPRQAVRNARGDVPDVAVHLPVTHFLPPRPPKPL